MVWRWKFFEDTFIRFDRIHERDRRTDRETDRRTDTAWRHRLRLGIASRGKKAFWPTISVLWWTFNCILAWLPPYELTRIYDDLIMWQVGTMSYNGLLISILFDAFSTLLIVVVHKGIHWNYLMVIRKLTPVLHFYRATRMHSADYAAARYMSVCPSAVCLSVIRRHSVWTIIHIKVFSLSGSPTILVFPYQTGWQYSDGDSPNGASNVRGMKKSQFSTNTFISEMMQDRAIVTMEGK